MKVIICSKIKETDPAYFQRAWRIPFQQLIDLGWVAIDKSDITVKPSLYFKEKYNEIPKVIFFWNSNSFIQNNWADILGNNWIKCCYMDDLHQENSKIINFRKSIFSNFDYVFVTCAYILPKFYPNTDLKKIIWYPHNVNNNFTVDFNKNPLKRILLSGCINQTIYPFRYSVSKLPGKYRVSILKQLSYQKPNHSTFGHNYIKHINKFIAAITCCSYEKTPYIVSKFFEIPAAGALLMAFDEYVKQPLKEQGFIDGENYMSVNFENVKEKILYVLDIKNRSEIDRIRMNGYKLVWGNHTLLHRAKMVNDMFVKKISTHDFSQGTKVELVDATNTIPIDDIELDG